MITALMDNATITPTNRYWELEGGMDVLTSAMAAPSRTTSAWAGG
ncbi:hypothetical protein OG389_29700 [Streptomyces sp. NBC_00435]